MAENFHQAVGDSAAQVSAKLGAIAADSAAGAAAGGGGKFSFEPDQIRAVITEWNALIDSFNKDLERADALINVKAPGDEYASRSMAESAKEPK